jgi:type VI protein secretion system component VasF
VITGSRTLSRLPERQGVSMIVAKAGSVRRSDSADTAVLLKGKAVAAKVRTGAVKVMCGCLFVCLCVCLSLCLSVCLSHLQRSESPTCDGVSTIVAESGSVWRSDSADTVLLLKGKAVAAKVRTGAVKVMCGCLFVCLCVCLSLCLSVCLSHLQRSESPTCDVSVDDCG